MVPKMAAYVTAILTSQLASLLDSVVVKQMLKVNGVIVARKGTMN